jgi:hypothetical protein
MIVSGDLKYLSSFVPSSINVAKAIVYEIQSQKYVSSAKHENVFSIAGELGGQAFILFSLFTFLNWFLTRNLLLDELSASLIRQHPKIEVD